MRVTTALFLAALLLAPLTASAGPVDPADGRCDLEDVLEELRSQRLKRKEKRDLLFMREEEKLARDVYLSLYEKWGLRAFRQIAGAEREHMSLTLVLIDKYELEDPVGDNPLGIFTDRSLQRLYEELSAAGEASLAAALTVGAMIEDVDLYDLERAVDRANNEDLGVLYQNLMKGSRNHLRAFTDLLVSQGESYAPMYLTPEEYESILDGSRERGILDAEGDLLCGGGRS